MQQDDTPLTIYERPANAFVAGFLGSPAMNLLRGRLECATACVHLPGGGRLDLSRHDPRRGALAAHDASEIVVGLRPEALYLPDGEGLASATLEAHLELIEHVGNEAFLNLRHGAQALIARVPPHGLPDPGPVRLAYDADRMHFFAGDSGQRIEAGAS